MQKKKLAFQSNAQFNSPLPAEFFISGLSQFPKVCQKCHKVYYDYSDWFAANTLGAPMIFKGSQLLFFRGCRCKNTLAMSVDFSSVLEKKNGDKGFVINEALALELRDRFIDEISTWKENTGRNSKFKNVIINTTDIKIIRKMLGLDIGQLENDEMGAFYDLKVPKFENCRLYISDSAESLEFIVGKSLADKKNFACSILLLTLNNQEAYKKMYKRILKLDPLFQVITYSEEISSVKDLGLDDNYHNCFSIEDESVPFMLINRMNSYYYLQ